MNGIEKMLQSQQLTFAFVGVAPSLIILAGLGRWAAALAQGRRSVVGKDVKQATRLAWGTMRFVLDLPYYFLLTSGNESKVLKPSSLLLGASTGCSPTSLRHLQPTRLATRDCSDSSSSRPSACANSPLHPGSLKVPATLGQHFSKSVPPITTEPDDHPILSSFFPTLCRMSEIWRTEMLIGTRRERWWRGSGGRGPSHWAGPVSRDFSIKR
jgi:hypothetical protein